MPAKGAWLAAGHAVGSDAPVTGKRGHRHRLGEPELAPSPGSPMPASGPAASAPDLVPLKPDGIAPLKHLRIGEPGVRHVGLHRVRAVEAVPGARTARYRLVVLVTGIA